MFFSTLETLSHNHGFKIYKPIIDNLDTWLALLPKSYKSRIIPEMFSRQEEVNISIVYTIFDKLKELSLLQDRYLVRCPSCGHVIIILDNISEVMSFIDEYNKNELECDFCEKSRRIDMENVYNIYKLIEEPKGDISIIKKDIADKFIMNDGINNLSARMKENPSKYKQEFGEDKIKEMQAKEMINFIICE